MRTSTLLIGTLRERLPTSILPKPRRGQTCAPDFARLPIAI